LYRESTKEKFLKIPAQELEIDWNGILGMRHYGDTRGTAGIPENGLLATEMKFLK